MRGAILRDGTRIDGRDTENGAADRLPGRPPAAGARLGAVHARRDTGAGRRDARHRPGRADHRRARGRVPRKLHAALQFPALLDRRGRPHGFARTARDRPRQARLARGAAAAAAEGELPLHDPRRLRDHRIERLVVDGVGVRRLARADGCRRAAAAPGRRDRDGADQGAGRLCRAVRHSRRRGSSRRHGLQGRRHRARHHRAADGHQDHLDHRGDHARRARSGARRARATSSARWPRR